MGAAGKRRLVGLVLGPLVSVSLMMAPLPQGMPATALDAAAVACLMAIWWISEAIPIAATALIPIVMFPALGVMSSAQTTTAYGNHLIYLFLGGFLIAMAMQKWNLHKRVALHIIRMVGTSLDRIVLGFMAATAFLSMWVSNTATAMMMLPIGLAVVDRLSGPQSEDGGDGNNTQPQAFGTVLMLGIAYAASVGGVATLIGTPPNAVLAGMVEKLYGQTISFVAWSMFALPLSMIMLLVAWTYLTRLVGRLGATKLEVGKKLITEELVALGPPTREELSVAFVFFCVALAWIVRGLVDIPALEDVSDSTIAIGGALLLFVIPSSIRKGEFLLDWKTAVKLPWDVILLFGGGFALAQGVSESGLAEWVVEQLAGLRGVSIGALIAGVTLLVIFLTEITSNTATATLVIPVAGALAVAVGLHPFALMVPVAVAASYAFMLPVATPPNAIVYSSRRISIPQMAKAGFWMNILATIAIAFFVLFVLPLVWDIDLHQPPALMQGR